ncbi:MAG: hypothetical protein ACHQ4H_06860 [Ktedonobacterales bacterium]
MKTHDAHGQHGAHWHATLAALALLAALLAGCGATSTGAGRAINTRAMTPPPAAGSASGTGTPTGAASAATATAHASTAAPTATLSGGSSGGAPNPSAAALRPPGAALPSEAACAQAVHRSGWEPRPDNAAANQTTPSAAQLSGVAPWNDSIGVDPRADAFRRKISGGFTGTTDEILQWTACVWGVPVEVVRAEAVIESWWHESQRGDWTGNQQYCPPGTWTGSGCYQSYGILQVKWYYFRGTYPMIRDDTAFNAEYVYGVIRTCFEGWTTYLNDSTPLPGYPAYHAGDLWGCIGRWYSGQWYDQGAVDYIAKVKATLAQKTWLSAGF